MRKILGHCLFRTVCTVLLVLAGGVTVMAQTDKEFHISGTVHDGDGEPMIGAIVRVQGTQVGAVTDAKGRYELPVVSGYKGLKLLFTYLGYDAVTKEMKQSGQCNVVLRQSENAMKQVVVTGYQTIDKTRMTGATDVITAKDIQNKGYADITDVLRGAMPGVSVRYSSGKLGGEPEIRIRGLNSLYGKMDPLWIVDGVPFRGSKNELIPEDIESITVLKDAAAAAIYGSQAANGVIVVKRKMGKPGHSQFNLSSSFSVAFAPKSKLNLMNTEQKIAYERSVYEDYPQTAGGGRVIELLRNADRGVITHEEAEAQIAELSKTNTNWYDELMRTTFSQNHMLSYSGGTEKTTYYAALGANFDQGLIPTNSYTNWNAIVRLQSKINKILSVTLNSAVTIRKDKDSDSGTDILTYATFANPYEKPYNEDGSYAWDRSYSSDLSKLKDGYKTNFNIFNELYNNTSETNNLSGNVSLSLTAKLLKGLTYKTVGSVYANYNNMETILGEGTATAQSRSWIRSIYSELPDDLNNGQLTENNGRSFNWTWRNQLDYSLDIKEKHFFSLFLGHEVHENKTKSNYVLFPEYDAVRGLASVPLIDAGHIDYVQQMITNTQSQRESMSRSVSWFAALNYSFMDRYVFSGSVRLDGSDIIGTENQYSPLWDASVRYNLHNEPFMKDVKWINGLSVRASYGYTGSIDHNALPYNVLSYLATVKFMDTKIPSNIRSKNPSIKWQTKQDRSLGLEGALLDNRLRFTVNYYNNVTRDLLDKKTLPISVGLSEIKYNSSSVQNLGWEFDVTGTILRTGDWHWNVSANLGWNRSKIIESYYKSIEDMPAGSSRTEPLEGSSTNSWLGYRFAGVDPRTGHTLAYVDNTGRETPIGFQREDGQWVLDMDDEANVNDKKLIKETLGNSYPPFNGGFGTSLQYKEWSLDVRFITMFGHKILGSYYSVASGGSVAAAYHNQLVDEFNRWRKPGDVTDIPGYKTSGSSSSLQSDMYDYKLEDGSFLKCSQISVGYRLKKEWCQKILLKSLRLNLNIRDMFTITRYSGLDPENFGAFTYPNSRKVMLSVNATF